MNFTQNDKIEQIKNETLVVGVDIGKENNYARALDNRGRELKKHIKFANTRDGFRAFDKWVSEVSLANDKTEAIVGFEPTGHYWFSFGDHCKRLGHKLAIVNPMHVKRTKELDDNSPTKNDKKDPKTIAMLVKDGRYREVYIPEDIYQELREAVYEKERLTDLAVAINNQVIRWLDIRFPEFTKVFSKWHGHAALMALKNFPTPDKVLKAGVDNIVSKWKEEISRAVGRKHAEKLMKAAEESIGRTTGSISSEVSLKNLIDQYELIMRQIKEQEALMLELLLRVPNADKLLGIKGVGLIAVATFVSEVGDISRFESPKQIIKLAGMNLKEDSSGKHKGTTRLSKRGRKRLRHSLFKAMITVLAKNTEFKAIHRRNITREINPLSKMQSIFALCGKLIRVFYAILSKGTEYDPNKLMIEIPSMKAA